MSTFSFRSQSSFKIHFWPFMGNNLGTSGSDELKKKLYIFEMRKSLVLICSITVLHWPGTKKTKQNRQIPDTYLYIKLGTFWKIFLTKKHSIWYWSIKSQKDIYSWWILSNTFPHCSLQPGCGYSLQSFIPTLKNELYKPYQDVK